MEGMGGMGELSFEVRHLQQMQCPVSAGTLQPDGSCGPNSSAIYKVGKYTHDKLTWKTRLYRNIIVQFTLSVQHINQKSAE